MPSRTLLALSLLSSLALSSVPLRAQVDVNVDTRIPIGVTPFSGNEALTKVVIDDLNRTLLFAATPGAGQKYTASGTVTAGTLTGQLGGAGGASLIAKGYSGDGRKAAHQFADDITRTLGHCEGFATSRLAAISGGSGHKELYVLDIDGANGLQLTNDKTISARPKWSADGAKIAYTSYKSGYPDAYVITLATNNRAHVAFFPGINTGAAFSPDGSRLALTLSKEGTPLIYTMPAAGGPPSRLTPGGGTETSPCWSPDGSKIVYDSDARGSVQLYTVPSGGGSPTRLATVSGYSAEPDWSPDGTKIAFTGRSGGQFQIGVYDLSTGQSSLVTTTGGQDPSWTHNSRHLVYSRGGGLWILDTVTHATARLDNGLTQAAEPAVSR